MAIINKNVKELIISSAATYGLLKLPMKWVDPYTRMGVGGLIGVTAMIYGAITRNHYVGWTGAGIAVGSILTFEEVYRLNGAKIVSNEYAQPVYTLDETEGVAVLQPYQIPDYRIDGLTIKGMNGVFKAHDGVYLKILADGTITPTFGLGSLVNKIGAGYMSESWVDGIGDKRWRTLFDKSV